MIHSSSLVWAFVVATGLMCSAGCGSTMSQIEQGKAITTKEATLDEFFKSVVELRGEIERAEDDRRSARADVVKALGLAESTQAEIALEAATQKAKKFDDDGTSLHLELTPAPKLCVLRKKRGKPAEDPAELAKAVEKSVKASIELAKRMGEIDQRARNLEAKRADLATKPAGKQGDAPRELEGAKVVLADVRARATNQAGLASSFVVGLAMAFETGAADTALARFNAKPRTWGGGRPGGGPAQGGPAKPKPSDDFEP